MNDQSFLSRRNSRTNLYGRGARPLDPARWISLAIDPAYAETYAGQVALLTAANLIGRMTPSVAIAVPKGISVRDPLPWAGRSLSDFEYQAASWDKPRRVIAKIEWHPGELFPKVGFIVTNLPMEPDWVVRFYNQRGTAEQHIKEGKYAFRWTRLSCRKFRHNEVRLQLHALAYNLATFLRCIELPEAMADWSLTSLQLKLIKIGARVVRHARAITFQLAEVAVTGPMVRAVLAAIRRLRTPPSCA